MRRQNASPRKNGGGVNGVDETDDDDDAVDDDYDRLIRFEINICGTKY